MTERYPWLRDLAIGGLLLLAVGVVFGQTVRYEFVNFDDDACVYENPSVNKGLTAEGLAQAFVNARNSSWVPLTWLSHMLDYQLYGPWAGGHHLTNLLPHAASVAVLFLVLRQMTGQAWPSAMAAALFAVHPLQVEAVAWVFVAEGRAERAALHADIGGVHGLCPPPLFAGPVSRAAGLDGSGAAGQADARDIAGGALAVGLLAVGPVPGGEPEGRCPALAGKGPLRGAGGRFHAP